MVLAQKAYILFYIQRQASTVRLPAFLSSAAAPLLPASSTAWTGYSNGVTSQQQQQQQQPGSPTAASRSSRRAPSRADDSASASPRGGAREANGFFRPDSGAAAGTTAHGDAGSPRFAGVIGATLRGEADAATAGGRPFGTAQPADGAFI